MFNDTFGLTNSVLSKNKTQTRRLETISASMKTRFELGEVVAIAQSYQDMGYDARGLDRSPKDYRIIRGSMKDSAGWKNKMFVRSDACKHHIRIVRIRFEYLQDISADDCIREGIMKNSSEDAVCYMFCGSAKNYNSARDAYSALIDKVSGAGTWDKKPLVVVYDFELVD